jgi:hypothetical protein
VFINRVAGHHMLRHSSDLQLFLEANEDVWVSAGPVHCPFFSLTPFFPYPLLSLPPFSFAAFVSALSCSLDASKHVSSQCSSFLPLPFCANPRCSYFFGVPRRRSGSVLVLFTAPLSLLSPLTIVSAFVPSDTEEDAWVSGSSFRCPSFWIAPFAFPSAPLPPPLLLCFEVDPQSRDSK